MLKVTYKKKILNLSHIWFYNNEKLEKVRGGGLLYLHGVKDVSSFTNNKNVIINTQHTLEKDITKAEEIFNSFGKHLRKHLHKSETDPIKIRFYDSKQLLENKGLLKISAKLYEKMFLDKEMQVSFNAKLAKKYAKKDALILAIAYTDNNTPIGFKAVIYEDKYARAWVTAFDFRNKNFDSQIISRAHQNMYYKMLQFCSGIGVAKFDFGGINSFEEPNGIAKFKMAFNGEPITYNNVIIGNSLLGRIAVSIMKRKSRRK